MDYESTCNFQILFTKTGNLKFKIWLFPLIKPLLKVNQFNKQTFLLSLSTDISVKRILCQAQSVAATDMQPTLCMGITYPAKSARNFGVIFDKNFNFCSHISVICSSCIYHIRDLRHIRRHLDGNSAKLLANALVSSRLDYCNSLLSGIAETDLTKLQRILNHLACAVTKSPPLTRSVSLLRSLHWLPVKYRVHFKICLLTYKALHEEQPVYLRSLIATSLPSRSLRSNGGITLSVLGLRPALAQGPSGLAPLLFGTTFHYLSVHPPQLPPSEDISKRTFSTWPTPPPPLPVDTGVSNGLLMLRNSLKDFCIWTPIWLLRHWAWLRRGNWRYRNFIDWLIDKYWAFVIITATIHRQIGCAGKLTEMLIFVDVVTLWFRHEKHVRLIEY